MPGLEIKVQGDDAPAVFRKGVLITGVTASAARDRSYELTFTAISGLRSGTVYRLMKETIS